MQTVKSIIKILTGKRGLDGGLGKGFTVEATFVLRNE